MLRPSTGSSSLTSFIRGLRSNSGTDESRSPSPACLGSSHRTTRGLGSQVRRLHPQGGGSYGYKVHLTACSRTGLPLAWEVATGKVNESTLAVPLIDTLPLLACAPRRVNTVPGVADDPILRATAADGEVYDDPSEDARFMFMEDLESPGSSFMVERTEKGREGDFLRLSLQERTAHMCWTALPPKG
jgi:hypothetical protein